MSRFQRICVFCGSRLGTDATFAEAAREMGLLLARRRIGVVYGGGGIGLMGALADAVLEAGGEVVGVIPAPLASKEVAHPGATRLHIVDSMHQRKSMMSKLADGFIAMPGGYGTLEEVLETITWAQLGIHRKPIGLLNLNGYFDPLIATVQTAVLNGFILPQFEELFVSESTPETLLDRLVRHQLPPTRQWIRPSQT